MLRFTAAFVALIFSLHVSAQSHEVIKNICKDAMENSQLEVLGRELIDGIGPRLVGSSQMKKAHDWVVEKYKSWGIAAENQQWGEWRGWERGLSQITMISPRTKNINGIQLAWSPKTPKEGISAEIMLLPYAADSISFTKLLPQVKGKIVMISMLQPTGRTDNDWEKYARKEDFEKMKATRTTQTQAWAKRITNTGFNPKNIDSVLERAGAVGIISSYWSFANGANKIFGTKNRKAPHVDISQEDYGLLYRLVEAGQKPVVKIFTDSKETGMQPTFNTIASIKGSEKPDEYVVLSAHLDSWDGGTGSTDNGTGVISMMEAMRLLKKWCPNPKRTIIAGHWGAEEQGINGSRAFIEDHPEIVKNIQAVFNQDGGTGRINFLNAAGFVHAYDYLGRWLRGIPDEFRNEIQAYYPGTPSGGGSDQGPFVAAGVPAYYMGTNNWDYSTLTWHTNLDTYDKIVFEDLKRSAIVSAVLAYMASEDPEKASRERIKLTEKDSKGNIIPWPPMQAPIRKGGLN